MQTTRQEDELAALYTAALLIVGNHEEAEESVVSAYVLASSLPPSLDAQHRLNLLMGEMVDAALKLASEQPQDSTGQKDLTLSELESGQSAIKRSFRSLAVNQRAAVALRDVAGLSRKEAAHILKTSRSNFRQLLSQGRMKLTESMTAAKSVNRPRPSNGSHVQHPTGA